MRVYKICFYVPESHLEEVKGALFAKGAGRLGKYQECCWQVRGEGQFRPMKGSHPFKGEADHLEVVTEYKVEMMCDGRLINSIVHELRRVHPYEEPAYDVHLIEDF